MRHPAATPLACGGLLCCSTGAVRMAATRPHEPGMMHLQEGHALAGAAWGVEAPAQHMHICRGDTAGERWRLGCLIGWCWRCEQRFNNCHLLAFSLP
jgi:hypothetical protein